jgi:hypothetical protein
MHGNPGFKKESQIKIPLSPPPYAGLLLSPRGEAVHATERLDQIEQNCNQTRDTMRRETDQPVSDLSHTNQNSTHLTWGGCRGEKLLPDTTDRPGLKIKRNFRPL